MSLVFLRHGKSEWNKKNKFTGWTNISLCEEGFMESLEAGKVLQNYTFKYAFTSLLSRTIETLRMLNLSHPKIGIDTIHYADELKERNYGDLTGGNKQELKEIHGETQMHLWRRGFYDRPPNGESLEDVTKRAGHYFDTLIHPILQTNENAIIVSHGNTLRALLVHWGFHTPTSIEHVEIPTGIPFSVDFNKKQIFPINTYELRGYQILDSRGFPTIEVKCYNTLDKKCIGKGSSPSGSSCGSNEVLELRDGNKNCYNGKSVFNAVKNVLKSNHILYLNNHNQTLTTLDKQIMLLDPTPMKNQIGGNTTTAMSFCIADTLSNLSNQQMFEYIANLHNIQINKTNLPTPLVNIINGGKHSITGELKIQEFMIYPQETKSVSQQTQLLCEVYYTLQKILVEKYGPSAKAIGDEGGFCPPIYTAEEALCVIEEAITTAGYKVNDHVFIALDCAASEFYNSTTKQYEVEKDLFLDGDQLIEYYGNLIQKHPALKSIEDGFHETDYSSWTKFTELYSDHIMIVGDDLFTSNQKLVKQGLIENWANTLLLKVNQIGTITEAIESAKLMFEKNHNVIVSHRSGETNHAYIIDLAIGIGAKYVKIGSPCRGERVSKFNRLLEIEHYFQYTHK